MSIKNNDSIEYDINMVDCITDDLIKVFAHNKENLTKNECKLLLNVIFETIFDEKLQNKNFNHIFDLISNKKNTIDKNNLSQLTKSFIISFDVNYLKNSSKFNNKICIKLDKNSLPSHYYIRKT